MSIDIVHLICRHTRVDERPAPQQKSQEMSHLSEPLLGLSDVATAQEQPVLALSLALKEIQFVDNITQLYCVPWDAVSFEGRVKL